MRECDKDYPDDLINSGHEGVCVIKSLSIF